MLRDVFYYGKKPNVHPREQYAENLQDARDRATTEHFWIINEFCNYRNFDWNFDFEFLPDEDVWAEEHNNVWPSQHQKDSGTWLCPKEHSDVIIYRNDVDPVIRKNEKQSENWVELDLIDHTKFDFSWHPDPSEPPYIYKWGCKFFPTELKHVLEYHVSGATQTKYMNSIVQLLPQQDLWIEHQEIDKHRFDMSWRPNPLVPPYIYIWGNRYINGKLKPTLEYRTPGATDKKYMPETLEVLPEKDRWEILYPVMKNSFDFGWRPDPREPDYNYVFGNNHYPAEVMPTIVYKMPGATQDKYVKGAIVKLDIDMSNWIITDDVINFDFSWIPNPNDPPYIYTWGNKYEAAELKPTLEYRVKGATQRKYMGNDVEVLPQWDRWNIIHDVVKTSFDFSWRPDPREPAFIYVFGNDQYDGILMPTIEYHCPDAVEIKYVDDVKAKLAAKKELFEHLEDSYGIDYSWRPDPTSPPYIYAWGNQWNKPEDKISVQFTVPGATQYKYMEQRAIRKPNMSCWEIPDQLAISSFDFSWEPNPKDPPYIYQFGTQWQKTGGPKYVLSDATETKYIDVTKATRLPNPSNFYTIIDRNITDFDYSWHPDETEEPYIYVFGNQWYSAEKEPTIEYRLSGATTKKYVTDLVATLSPDMTNWETPDNIDIDNFDFSWYPDPDSPAYIYQFGTQLDNADGPRYITPNNTGEIVYLERVNVAETLEIAVGQYYIETTLDDLVNEHPNEVFWALRKNINYDTFDFTWQPASLRDLEYVQVFGSVDSELTQTYYVSAKNYLRGNKNFKFAQTIDLNETPFHSIFIKPDMFYIDRGNEESDHRFELLKQRFGNKIQKTRYLNSWVDTINRCNKKSTTDLTWILNSELDYSEFKFDYYPNPWQIGMVHVFGTQWSHWGTTFLVNKQTFEENTVHIKIIEHLPNLNFVKTHKAKATSCVHDVAFINHENVEATDMKEVLATTTGKDVVSVTYKKSYLDTIRELLHLLPQKKEHYVWVCSSVCDYSKFDFSYICDPFGRDNLHVFPSNGQKFGDTFFLDVNYARSLLLTLDNLEQHPKLNFNPSIKALRLKEPVIVHDNDTHINSLTETFGFPYATVVTSDNKDIPDDNIADAMNLWSTETKNIIITSTGATRIVVPKEAGSHVQKELYDYPYIKRAPKLVKSNPLDIVFLSNGETGAEENYQHLLKVTENLPNRVVRVDGVNGRAKAYHAAADASNTPWFFTVFAKLQVNSKFDWSWQPDRMQVPKHYIFHAKNPVNGLIYGHQAMIAYNKKLTLGNEGRGLDFTLDDEHEVVPLISGTAMYNTDSFSTWRTAFREVLKLKTDDSEESRVRLDAWLNKADGDYSEYSIKGALDAEEYYEDVEGDFDKLKLSYEWAWLRKRFDEL
jgi:hypothetical protein